MKKKQAQHRKQRKRGAAPSFPSLVRVSLPVDPLSWSLEYVVLLLRACIYSLLGRKRRGEEGETKDRTGKNKHTKPQEKKYTRGAHGETRRVDPVYMCMCVCVCEQRNGSIRFTNTSDTRALPTRRTKKKNKDEQQQRTLAQCYT